ncbi:MAG: ATP-binding protein [Nitrospirota bacterium]|nr:ATP-binding protein [Nitrospirota bacterium]
MKGHNATSVPLLGGAGEWAVDAPSLKNEAGQWLKNPSLHVAIQTIQPKKLHPEGRQSHENDHRQRLVHLGEQVGRLAHDIRNPLTSIEWLATLLGREHRSQQERQKLAEQCIQAVRSLDRLVSNVLVLSGPQCAQREPVNISSLLDEVEMLAMYPLRKKRLMIHYHREKSLTTILGDESLLQQALLNILVNAIHASAPDSCINLSCRKESRLLGDPGLLRAVGGVAIRIRDHGCGMSVEERANMFLPFYSKRKGGTGLGLSIVKQIVHLHQGVIDITSQQGKGTSVDLFFPQ